MLEISSSLFASGIRRAATIVIALGCVVVSTAVAQTHAWTARQEARLRPSDVVGPYSFYRDAVSVSGDRCAIGWPKTNTPVGQAAGSVHVYRRSGGAWIEEARLTAADGQAFATFGASVALDGDTLAIGAVHQSLPQIAGSGVVYVFERSNGAWHPTAEFRTTDPGASNFGISVELQGDRIVTAAPGYPAVYVFERVAGTWTQQARLTGPVGYGFGSAVALDGDTIVAGIPEYAAGGKLPSNSGAAIVFRKTGGNWSQEALIVTPAPIVDSLFGESVAIDGDRIVVGTPRLNGPSGSSQGFVFAYERTGTTWAYAGEMLAPDGAQGDGLGWSVAIAGNVVVAAASAKRVDGVSLAGALYVFEKGASAWIATEQISAAAPVVGEDLGYCLSFDRTSILAGTNTPTNGAAVYVFRIAWPSFCFGDGSLVTPCPCAAPDTVPSPSGAPRSGCANSLDLRGARLAASGLVAPEHLSFDAFVGPSYSGFGFLVKGDANVVAGLADGDGLRCVDGNVVRFGDHAAGSNGDRVGSWTYPNDVQTALVSSATVQPAGTSAYYQLCYRDTVLGFCTPSTFNWSNAVRADWP